MSFKVNDVILVANRKRIVQLFISH